MTVGLYLRVSTQEQANEGYSIGEQESRLKDYCKAMRWNVGKIYIDPGYSGGDTNRPGLQDLINDVTDGKLDRVVVYKLDRLSRSQLDTLYLIEKVFLKNGVDFVSMSENFDTSTPFGRAMIGILAVFAQLEREQIRERMSMGKEARAKTGKFNGGTQPIGYDYDPSRDLLVINDFEAMQIKELYEMFLQGASIRMIERVFSHKGYTHKHGLWDPKTIRRALQNKLYLGYINYHGQAYKGDHEPIIDPITHDKAVALMTERQKAYKNTGVKPGAQTTLLGGLLYCRRCTAKFTKQAGKKRKDGTAPIYYTCHSRVKKVKKMIKDPSCFNDNWKMDDLDNIIISEIRKLATDSEYFNTIKHDSHDADLAGKIQIIESEIKKIDTQISRFMDLYGIGKFTIEQVSQKVDPLAEQKSNLEEELQILQSGHGDLTEKETREIIGKFEEVFERDIFDEKRLMIDSLIDRIELNGKDVNIFWKFA